MQWVEVQSVLEEALVGPEESVVELEGPEEEFVVQLQALEEGYVELEEHSAQEPEEVKGRWKYLF
mgnify:CR=1 FL=1